MQYRYPVQLVAKIHSHFQIRMILNETKLFINSIFVTLKSKSKEATTDSIQIRIFNTGQKDKLKIAKNGSRKHCFWVKNKLSYRHMIKQSMQITLCLLFNCLFFICRRRQESVPVRKIMTKPAKRSNLRHIHKRYRKYSGQVTNYGISRVKQDSSQLFWRLCHYKKELLWRSPEYFVSLYMTSVNPNFHGSSKVISYKIWLTTTKNTATEGTSFAEPKPCTFFHKPIAVIRKKHQRWIQIQQKSVL
jgi:hypothetical protein